MDRHEAKADYERAKDEGASLWEKTKEKASDIKDSAKDTIESGVDKVKNIGKD